MAWRRTVGSTTVERFVAVLVAGGIALVAGLWVTAFTSVTSPAWLAGVALAGVGGVGVAIGIAAGIDVGPL